MGQTLSAPATRKTSETDQSSEYVYSVSEMQGWRISMEDAHAAVLALETPEGSPPAVNSFFAVYDGHGGGTVAKFAGQNVHKRLLTEPAYKEKKYEEALKRAFLGTDEDLLANPAHVRDPSGCTAVGALIADRKIYVANAGDSRSVISVKGEVKPLSFDHKPTNEGEKARITAGGGYVEYGRVNGNLALSRAIGDFEFKKNSSLPAEKQVITADPDVTVHEMTDEDEFLVIACDGIWDCLTNQQVVNYVRRGVAQGKELTEIGEAMCDHCLAPDTASGAGIGCDNMTVMIVAILNGRTKEQWYEWIKERVDSNYGYTTPEEPPQIYAASRLAAFKMRQQGSQQARDQRNQNDLDESPAASFLNAAGLGGFARVLGSTGGISFQPGGNIMGDSGNLMFGPEDSDDEDDSDDAMEGSTFFSEALGLGNSSGSETTADAASVLKARIEAYEKDLQDDSESDDDFGVQTTSSIEEVTESSSSTSNDSPIVTSTSSEAPPPSKTSDTTVQPVPQLKSTPGGDEPSPAVKAEGLMDTSEDPTRA